MKIIPLLFLALVMIDLPAVRILGKPGLRKRVDVGVIKEKFVQGWFWQAFNHPEEPLHIPLNMVVETASICWPEPSPGPRSSHAKPAASLWHMALLTVEHQT